MSRAICDVEYSGYAATRARRFAHDTITAWRLSDIVLEVEMVTTELVTNAVLHGAPPISLELAHHGDILRISVRDNSATAPVVSHAAADAMTGRGLALVGSLSAQWGVVPAGGGRSGKLVWAELATADVQAELPRPRTESEASRSAVRSASAVSAEAALQADADAVHVEVARGGTADFDLFLDDWEALSSAAAGDEPTFTVVLKDVPTRLLLDVEAHVDNVVRELTLASSKSAADERTSSLHGPLAELLREVVGAFGDVRHHIKRQAVIAAAKGEQRVDLSLTMTAATVEAGERYLTALSEVDEFARAERLLTAESPSEHRIFRAWCVGSLIEQTRAHAHGEAPQDPPAFEEFLLAEVVRILSSRLEPSDTHLDLALAAASGGAFEWDLHTDLLSLDERMRAIFGIDESETGTRAEAMKARVHADDRAMVDSVVERAVSRLDDFSVEYRIRRPDGAVRWIDCRGRVLPGPDGQGQRLIGVAFDSTELREARDGVARTLEHMGDAFLSLDPSWRVTYMNTAAERMLGRDRASLVGHVLWTQFPGAVGGLFDHECRLALETRRPLAFERYVESTGRHFEVRVHPIPEGLGVYFTDITEIRRFEREQAELRAASQHAHSEAERARRRLSFIADTAADMTTSLDPGEVCRRLAAHAAERLADWVSIYLVEGHQCVRVAATHRDPQWKGVIAQLVNSYPIDISSNSTVARSIRTGHPMVEQHVTEEMVLDTYPDPEARALIQGAGVESLLVVPMVARDDVLGAIVFMRSEAGNEFEPEDQRLASTLAGRAALAVQNAQLYSRQTTVVEALQQAVLPERLPAISGIQLSARYEPARGGAGVGGDFYDVFYLPSGRIALAVGDAAGHGLRAGALMGQLRNALRAYAFQEQGPLATLRSLSELIGGLEPDAFATAFYAELDPRSGELRWANAGHPPPLIAVPGEPSRYLEGPTSPPLGIFSDFGSLDGALFLPPGSGVLMYTDGLVERRHIDITDSLQSLQALLDKEPPCPSCLDLVVDGMRDETGFTDDVCVLLAVRSVDL